MKSFIFCTSFVRDRPGELSFARWSRWIDYYLARRELFGSERLFLIDDGSPLANLPPELSIVSCDETLPDVLPNGPLMFRFQRHFGRASLRRFPGWWRSFSFSSQIARTYGFEKIMHFESDAFVISRQMADHVRSLAQGWTAFWCPRHRIPESSIQVICGDSIARLARFYDYGEPFWRQRGPLVRARAQMARLERPRLAHRYLGLLLAVAAPQTAEFVLPFDEVTKTFVGDRYGEYGVGYPATADYVCQSPTAMRFDHELRPEKPGLTPAGDGYGGG